PGDRGLLLLPRRRARCPVGRFFGLFNRVFERATNGYLRLSGALIRKSVIAVVGLVAFASGSLFFAKAVPTSFLPDEDQGYLYIQMQLPEASSIQTTAEATRAVEEVLKETPGVKYATTAVGFSALSLTRSTYNAFFWVTLEPWEHRKDIEQPLHAIKA